MLKLTTLAFLTAGTLATSDFLRILDDKKDAKKYYGDDVKIEFKSQLGCGSCIKGGYIYCIPGAEGSDPDTWGGKKAVCCKDAASCTADKTYLCSNSYSDASLSKAMCPFKKSNCGNSAAFSFDSVGQKQSINISLPQGEACSY